MYKRAFKSFLDLANYYDNGIYNHIDAGQEPEFELHNVTARLAMMYEMTLEYSELQLSAEYNCLRATNPRIPKTMAKQALICETALNGFAIQKLLDHNLVNIKFPSAWKKQLAKIAIRLQWLSSCAKNFFCHANCNFQAYIYTLINWLRLLLVQFWLILQIYQTLKDRLKTHQKMCSSQLDQQLC